MKRYYNDILKYLPFGLMLIMAACVDRSIEDELDMKPVRLIAGQAYNPTRAITTDVQGAVFDPNELVNVFITGESDVHTTTHNIGGSYPLKYRAGEASFGQNPLNIVNSSDQPYYDEGSNSKIHVFAAYPANDEVNVTPDMTTFTVKYDQRTVENYKNSDLMMVAPFDHDKTAATVTLPFQHKMAKLIVTAIADGEVTVDDEITIGSMKRSVAIDVEKGDFAYTTEAPTEIPLSDENEDDYTQRKIKILNGGAAVFPPQTLTAVEFILITGKDKDGNERTAQFNIIDKTFKEGRVYKLNLHISNDDFTLDNQGNPHVSTITGWSEDYDELTVTPSGGYSGVHIADIDGYVSDQTSTSGTFTEDGYYIYSKDADNAGIPCCPTPAVTYGDNNIPMNEGEDFRYVYVDNVNAGNNSQVMIIGLGKYAGLAALKPFTIKRATGKISFPENCDKTGENAVPYNPDENIGFIKAINTGDGVVTYSVIADGEGESTDCVSVDPTDGYVIIQNKGKCRIKATAATGRNYDYPAPDDTCTYKIEIVEKEVKVGNLTITYAPLEFTYDGTTKSLTKLVVADGEHTLTENVDYTYTLTDSLARYEGLPIHHGTALLTITGKGNYSSTTSIKIGIPIKQATPTLTVKETDMALGEYRAAAPKDRRKRREATTEEWAQNNIRYSVDASDITKKDNDVLTVTDKGLLTGKVLKEEIDDQPVAAKSTTVYVQVAADESTYQDWKASEQKSFKVTVYRSDFKFTIKRFSYGTYYAPQLHILADGTPEGAHTKWEVPANGKWQIDCYGAQGGTTPKYTTEQKGVARDADEETNTPAIVETMYSNQGTGGRGAHIAGRIPLTKGMKLHVNLGQEGRVVYPGEQRVRGPKSEIATSSYNSTTDNLNSPNSNCTNNRGRNSGRRYPGTLGYLKAGDYEWAAFAWNGGGGFVWGGRCVYRFPNFYNQDNEWVGNRGGTQVNSVALGLTESRFQWGQSFVVFPITGGGGATDVSLAWDEDGGVYTPPTTGTDEQKKTAWQTGVGNNMVNREYGVGVQGDNKNMVGVQWKNPAHLFSRIIVAGGGGGGLYYDSSGAYGDGGVGGAWEGTAGLRNDRGEGGHMNAGGRGGVALNWNMTNGSGTKIWARDDGRTGEYASGGGTGTNWRSDMVYMDGAWAGGYSCSDGLFGEGGYSTQSAQGCGGGGGGWYGGGSGGEASSNGTGGGGSSFLWTDQVNVKRYDYTRLTGSYETDGVDCTTTYYESGTIPMYKLYNTINSDWVKYNKCITGAAIKVANPTTPPDHLNATKYYQFMPTNETANATRNEGEGKGLGIECPFFDEVVTKDAGANAGDGWATIKLVEIDEDQPEEDTAATPAPPVRRRSRGRR